MSETMHCLFGYRFQRVAEAADGGKWCREHCETEFDFEKSRDCYCHMKNDIRGGGNISDLIYPGGEIWK